MPYPTISLQKLIRQTRHWSRVDEDGIYSAASFDKYDEDQEYAVTPAELSVLHPLLPETINAMIVHNWNTNRVAHVTGIDFCAALALLEGKSIKFIDVAGQERHVSYLMGISQHSENPNAWMIGGYDVQTKPHTIAGQNVLLVTGHEFVTRCADAQDLENRYPGWQERWKIGQDLGLSLSELQVDIFKAAPEPITTHTMQQITFE